MNYYNENDKRTAAWLRELIKKKLISDGEVDERSITEVKGSDVKGFAQCHFFAGIGGWSYALRLAEWPDDKPVWTGSCPCQPFSQAGKGQVDKDERHLWPAFRELISECGPSIAFGEQVCSPDGRIWLAGIRTDLEALGYVLGAVDTCAASCGSPQIRQRLYWVAESKRDGRRTRGASKSRRQSGAAQPHNRSPALRVGQSNGSGCQQRESTAAPVGYRNPAEPTSNANRMGNSYYAEAARFGLVRLPLESEQGSIGRSKSDAWNRCEIVGCANGKERRFESGSFPLADGFYGRVGLLRGYGNAIVPQLACEFIKAYAEL